MKISRTTVLIIRYIIEYSYKKLYYKCMQCFDGELCCIIIHITWGAIVNMSRYVCLFGLVSVFAIHKQLTNQEVVHESLTSIAQLLCSTVPKPITIVYRQESWSKMGNLSISLKSFLVCSYDIKSTGFKIALNKNNTWRAISRYMQSYFKLSC